MIGCTIDSQPFDLLDAHDVGFYVCKYATKEYLVLGVLFEEEQTEPEEPGGSEEDLGYVGLYVTSGFDRVSGNFTLCLILPDEEHKAWESYKKLLERPIAETVVVKGWALHRYDNMSTHWKKRGKRGEEQISYHLFEFMEFYGKIWLYYWTWDY